MMLKPVTSLFLAFLILFSSTGVTAQVHECSVKGRLIGLYGSAVSCCSILKLKPKRALGSCCKLKKSQVVTVRRVPCCQDQVLYQHLDIQQIGQQGVAAEQVQHKVIPMPWVHERLLTIQFIQRFNSNFPLAHPPPLRRDSQSRFCQYRC